MLAGGVRGGIPGDDARFPGLETQLVWGGDLEWNDISSSCSRKMREDW